MDGWSRCMVLCRCIFFDSVLSFLEKWPFCSAHKLWIQLILCFASCQWETALLCNDVSHWLDANLASVLWVWGGNMQCDGQWSPNNDRIWPYTVFLVPLGMMTSSHGNIFRVTGPLCGEFTQRPVTRSFDVFFICVWINGWVNNCEAGNLRRHRGHYDVNVMV